MKSGSVAAIERFEDIKALDLEYLTIDEFSDLRLKAEEVAKSLSGFITYLAPKGPM
ncbi:MAG: hypothetical protein HXY51_11550 [Nitrospirae bacterium]|nr:hypothetical protein [Nitrospirota bacterium]